MIDLLIDWLLGSWMEEQGDADQTFYVNQGNQIKVFISK